MGEAPASGDSAEEALAASAESGLQWTDRSSAPSSALLAACIASAVLSAAVTAMVSSRIFCPLMYPWRRDRMASPAADCAIRKSISSCLPDLMDINFPLLRTIYLSSCQNERETGDTPCRNGWHRIAAGCLRRQERSLRSHSERSSSSEMGKRRGSSSLSHRFSASSPSPMRRCRH